MTLAEFRASLADTDPPPACRRRSPRCGATPRAIGTARTISRRPTKAATAIGCTPISTARRATTATPPIGIAAPASPFARASLDEEWAQIAEALLAGRP